MMAGTAIDADGCASMNPSNISMASTGIDIIKVGVFDKLTDEVITSLKEQAIKGANSIDGKQFTIVMVFFVDKALDLEKIPELAKAGIRGVMLDTADKTKGNLRSHMQYKDLKAFVMQAKSYGMLAGLAGSLNASDISSLLELDPDYLGFRGALCKDNLRIQALDSAFVKNIRSLVSNIKEDSIQIKTGYN